MTGRARIDHAALADNLAMLRSTVAPARVMAVVKADAYGHGAIEVAHTAVAAGADWIGVATLDEAFALRGSGIGAPILAWLHDPGSDFTAAAAARIDVGVSTSDQLERAAAAGAAIQLKLDTGLRRNGFAPRDAPDAFARAAALERAGRLRVRGIFSHLSNTSPADDARQVRLFQRLVELARDTGLDPELRHLAATEAAVTIPEARLDLVRIGAGMYGIAWPSGAGGPRPRPVMELSAPVVAVRTVPAGSGVSYGYAYRTSEPTTLALVPLGYADGVPRIIGGEVLLGGRRRPVAGVVAMDQIVVDAGHSAVRVGDRVVVWGDPASGAPSADEWAAWAGTVSRHIVTGVGGRVARTADPAITTA